MSRHFYHSGKPYSHTTFIPRFDSALTPGTLNTPPSPVIRNAPFVSPRSSFTAAIVPPEDQDNLNVGNRYLDRNLPDGKLSQEVVLLTNLKIQQVIVEQYDEKSSQSLGQLLMAEIKEEALHYELNFIDLSSIDEA